MYNYTQTSLQESRFILTVQPAITCPINLVLPRALLIRFSQSGDLRVPSNANGEEAVLISCGIRNSLVPSEVLEVTSPKAVVF